MKKFILSISLMVGLLSLTNAQVGGSQLNVGVGFDSNDGVPVYLGYEYFVTEDISLGGELSYSSSDEDFSYSDGQGNVINSRSDYSTFGIGATGNYHFDRILTLPEEWNVYGGINLTYFNYNYDSDFYSGDDGELNLGVQIGGRYFFSPNWGANLQFNGGSAVSGGRIGVTYKF